MRRTLLFALPLALALIAVGAPPAEAGIGFSVHGGFRVGGIHFDLGLLRSGPHYGSGYYYRVREPLRYRSYGCGDACYRHSSVSYHHAACPLVLHHFRTHRFAPPPFVGHGYYVPRYDGRFGLWYGDHGYRYDGHDRRYDDRYRYRYDGRYRYDSRYYYRDRYDRRHDGRYDRRDRRDDRRHDGHRDRGRRRHGG